MADLESKETSTCACSESGTRRPVGACIQRKSGLDSHDVEIRLGSWWEVGLGIIVFTVDVSLGEKVIISPLCKPTATCLPLGDQQTW